jgi:hypothetical protein
MQGSGSLIRVAMACLLVLASLVSAPAPGFAEIHPGMAAASCAEGGEGTICVASIGRDRMTTDDGDCRGDPAGDRHCCSHPQCLSAYGAPPPHGAVVSTGPGTPANRSSAVDRLVGAEPDPGMRPPKSGA